jgi:hypothetical protein
METCYDIIEYKWVISPLVEYWTYLDNKPKPVYFKHVRN